jgi:phenylacetic acid degradation operon negative regulatory protein
LRPLTARSVVASVLLGTHPPVLPVAALVRVGELFGIAEGTVRVALSRMAADGELIADSGSYRLGGAFGPRQASQDRGRSPEVVPWHGGWEVAVMIQGTEGDDPAPALEELRLAPAGGRTWMRPANLRRADADRWPTGARRLQADGDGDLDADRALAATLWDLPGWAADARELLDAFRGADSPAARFVVAAAILRHLRTDPVLPPALLEGPWPDQELRAAYSAFTLEMRDILVATTA